MGSKSIWDEIPNRDSNETSVDEMSKKDAKRELKKAAPRAVATLIDQLTSDDEKIAQNAAIALLDRSGYGPKSTMLVGEVDPLENLNDEQLDHRLDEMIIRLQQLKSGNAPKTPGVIH